MLILASTLLLSPPPAPVANDAIQPPPGMVLIEGGRTKVGSSQKDVERLLEENPTLTSYFGPFSAETPQVTVDVDDFFLMVTEVTNEQYRAYIEATGVRPPFHWAADAVEAARVAFLDEQAQKRNAAKEKGDPPPPREEFRPQEWWYQNWKGKEWRVPDGQECKPVVWVDYQDAVGYARWAGLRLMTEEEYQRAVRGDTDRPYPWGDAWETGKYAATQEIKQITDTFEVGQFAEGASADGIFDLAGNVWEWTSSKYVGFGKSWKAFKMEFGKGSQRKTLDGLPSFSPDRRVAVGGCFQSARHMARATIRRGTDRSTTTNSLGFRCAASVQKGRDIAETVVRDIPPELRPENVNGPLDYDTKIALALDRWQLGTPSCGVAGYGVIEGYDYILFTPVSEVYQVTLKDLRDYSLQERLVPLGFLSTTQPMIEPALEPGTYVVSFRGGGEPPKPAAGQPASEGEEAAAAEAGQEPAQAPAPPVVPLEQQLSFDVTADHYILIDVTGKPVAALPAKGADLGRAAAGSIRFVDRKVMVPAPAVEGKKPEMVEEIQKWLHVDLAVPARARKVFQGTLGLRFAEGVAEMDWR